jgi:hypothetical protein
MIENNTGRCSFKMNGNIIELIFGMPACERFYKSIAEGSVLMDEDGNIQSSTGIACLLMAGYANHCVYEDKPIKLKTGDFLDFIENSVDDQIVQDELIIVGTCFKNSISVTRYLERKQKEADSQKKRIAEALAGTS